MQTLNRTLGTLLLSCLFALALPTRSNADARTDIEAASKNYALLLKAKDADRISAMFTTDGQILNPGMPDLTGPEAIRKFLTSIPATVKVEASDMTTTSIEIGENDATQWGTYSQRVVLPEDRAPVTVTGRFVAHWKKQADGRWLLRRMLTQPNPPQGR